MDHDLVDTEAQRLARARELGELVDAKPENVDAALPEFEALLAAATDPVVVAEVLAALSLCWDPRAPALILKHLRPDHDDPRVRLELARSLGHSVEPEDQCWEPVVAALIALSRDTETSVRDWACFGLGQLEVTTPVALEALADRLTDTDDDTRCEALAALAAAGDPRALDHLQVRLAIDVDSDDVWKLELAAAAALADLALFPLLTRLEREWDGDEDDFTEVLSYALKRCHPMASARARQIEQTLIKRINTLLDGTDQTVRTRGAYPRTTVVADPSQVGASSATELQIWSDQEPGSFRLEQEAIQMSSHFSQHGEQRN